MSDEAAAEVLHNLFIEKKIHLLWVFVAPIAVLIHSI